MTTSAKEHEHFPQRCCEEGDASAPSLFFPSIHTFFIFQSVTLYTMFQNQELRSPRSMLLALCQLLTLLIGTAPQGRQAANSALPPRFVAAPANWRTNTWPTSQCSAQAGSLALQKVWILHQVGEQGQSPHSPALSIRNVHGYKIFPPS